MTLAAMDMISMARMVPTGIAVCRAIWRKGARNMKRPVILLMSLLAAGASTSIAAQPSPPETVVPSQTDPADLPSQALAADTARLAVANRVATQMWPDGNYARLMQASFADFATTHIRSLMSQQLAYTAELGDKDGKEARRVANPRAAGLSQPTEAQLQIFVGALLEEMIPLVGDLDAPSRSAIATGLAQRYDAAQLVEIEQLLSTPTGRLFGRDIMIMMADPTVTQDAGPRISANFEQIVRRAATRAGIAIPDDPYASAADAAAAAASEAVAAAVAAGKM